MHAPVWYPSGPNRRPSVQLFVGRFFCCLALFVLPTVNWCPFVRHSEAYCRSSYSVSPASYMIGGAYKILRRACEIASDGIIMVVQALAKGITYYTRTRTHTGREHTAHTIPGSIWPGTTAQCWWWFEIVKEILWDVHLTVGWPCGMARLWVCCSMYFELKKNLLANA